jgi:hypothetical protein
MHMGMPHRIYIEKVLRKAQGISRECVELLPRNTPGREFVPLPILSFLAESQ